MGACETTPTTTRQSPGTPTTRLPYNPEPGGRSSRLMMRRRSSVSSSYVLARSYLAGCGRSNWTPPTRRREHPGDHEERPTTVQPDRPPVNPRQPRRAARLDPCALLTGGALMGAAGRSHLNEGPWRAIWTSCAQSDAVGQRRRRRELPRLGVQSTCQGDAGRIQHRGEPPVVATQRCPTAFDRPPRAWTRPRVSSKSAAST